MDTTTMVNIGYILNQQKAQYEVHRQQKVYERFCLPRIRPLRWDYFNTSLSENPCM